MRNPEKIVRAKRSRNYRGRSVPGSYLYARKYPAIYNTSIRCIHTPGHTNGVMSFILNLSDGTVAGMHGGVGCNSMHSDFLKRYGLSFECRRLFKKSLYRLSQEKVDLVLGNHPEQNNTIEKMRKIFNGEDSILNVNEWSAFLSITEKSINKLIESDPE